jgi:site-specific recombinase XerD
MIYEKELPRFVGPFAELAENFIRHKQSLGYKYESERKMMRLFCEFSSRYSNEDRNLSKDLIEAWFSSMADVAVKTKELRLSTIKLFARYMTDLGCTAYIPPKQKIRSTQNFIPYVFSHHEISNILRTCDNMKSEWRSRHTQLLMPVILRLLYSTGLRVSEALNLKMADVDLSSGILRLRQTKTDHDRYVPLSATALDFMKEYFLEMHSGKADTENLFFRKYDGNGFVARTIHQYFKKILWRSGISYGGKGIGPRLHDLRHTFAVNRLLAWYEEGADVHDMLQILSTYMGHAHFEDTTYYLNASAELMAKGASAFTFNVRGGGKDA